MSEEICNDVSLDKAPTDVASRKEDAVSGGKLEAPGKLSTAEVNSMADENRPKIEVADANNEKVDTASQQGNVNRPNQQEATSPRKVSQQEQPQRQSAAWRKYSQRQHYLRMHYPPEPPVLYFQVPQSRETYERQQSLPGYYKQGEESQGHRQSGSQRYDSSGNVSFQTPRVQFQQLQPPYQQKYYRKTSWQPNYDNFGRMSNNEPADGTANRKYSSSNRPQRKSSAPTGPVAAVKAGRQPLSSPRWSNLSEAMENGYGDNEYYDFDLEEPFSESDEDETPAEKEARRKRQAKPMLLLPTPRRRIRTLSGMIPAVGYSPVWGGPTMCLNCLLFFDLPKQTADYVEHLLEAHKIVVTDIELIVDLKRYIEHWRHRFAEEPIDKIFPVITPAEGDQLFGKVDKYYLMSEKLPEDRQVRERLALRRLEEVLSCQQRERDDRTFSRQCLFCRYILNGNRAKLIHHLYTCHRLNLGSPDNLVFVNEYIDVLESKMSRSECIKCEKTFADFPTMAEHMRKKLHREVNPKNNYYDKFYVINYLELGKKWLEVLAEDFEDTMPAFADSDEEEEEESWNEWQEDADDENEMAAVCLFCDEAFQEAAKLLDHMKGSHEYDLRKVFQDGRFTFYDRVKFINYIRKSSHDFVCFICGVDNLNSWPALRKHLETADHLVLPVGKEKWDKEDYLVPTYDNDNLLCLLDDILELDEEKDFECFTTNETSAPSIDASNEKENALEQTENDEMQAQSDGDVAAKEENVTANSGGSEADPKQASQKASAFVVIPEELPDVKESALSDPEIRDQLQ